MKFINESGFYTLIFSSKLESAKLFKHWVTSQGLPSIRKEGYYKLFNNPKNNRFIIGNEFDLHTEVVEYIRKYYPNTILQAALGEKQITSQKRIDSYKKGFQGGQPDIIIMNYHKYYIGFCIQFKSPTNNYNVSDKQLQMKDNYIANGYKFNISNYYDHIYI